jgi:hypothetical protein
MRRRAEGFERAFLPGNAERLYKSTDKLHVAAPIGDTCPRSRWRAIFPGNGVDCRRAKRRRLSAAMWALVFLLVLACLVGLIAGWRTPVPRVTFLRPLNKPKRAAPPAVLVPPGPTPRLIPSESSKATRPRSTPAPGSRQTPAGIRSSGAIDYIAAFAGSAEASEATRVDYLLEAGDAAADPPEEPHQTARTLRPT